MRRPVPLLAAVAWSLLTLPVAAAAAPRSHVIVVDKMKFGPVSANIRKGDLIVWDNRDLFRHSATAKGGFDVDLPAGKTVRMRATASGRFAFVCKFHPGMRGVLQVAK